MGEICTNHQDLLILDMFGFLVQDKEFIFRYISQYTNGKATYNSETFRLPIELLTNDYVIQLSLFSNEEKKHFKLLDLMSL